MGLYFGEIEGARILVEFAGWFEVVWEYRGSDWKDKLLAKKDELSKRYDTLYIQGLRPYSTSLEKGETVFLEWFPLSP